MISIEGTEGFNPNERTTAGRIFQRRIVWNYNMIVAIAENNEILKRKLEMGEANIREIIKDSLALPTSTQITTPRGVYPECRFWGKCKPWD